MQTQTLHPVALNDAQQMVPGVSPPPHLVSQIAQMVENQTPGSHLNLSITGTVYKPNGEVSCLSVKVESSKGPRLSSEAAGFTSVRILIVENQLVARVTFQISGCKIHKYLI